MPDPKKYETSAPTFSVLEPERFPALVELMAAGLREEGARKAVTFDREFWDWQYRRAPAGPAKVYGAFLGGELAGYYHVPLYRMMIHGRPGLAGAIQDVAVRPWAQGRGLFRGLSAFATADLEKSGVDLLYTFPNSPSVHNAIRAVLRALGHDGYTFPNSSSIHTFLKYDNYRKIMELGSWVMPVRSAARALNFLTATPRDGFALESHDDFSPEVAALFAPRSDDRSVSLIRDAAYLRWRFLERPKAKYFILSLREGGLATAAAVFKYEPLFGAPALLLMDYATLPGRDADMLELLLRLRGPSRKTLPVEFDLIFAASAPDFAPNPFRAGFLPVPGPLNPRRINLLCRSFKEDISAAGRWRVRLSDWDVF